MISYLTNYYPEYIKYTLDNNMFAEEFYRNGHGIVADLWTTKYSEMKHIRIPEPSYIKQKKIADYLNEKCLKIDEIIKDNNKEIELLNEYKKSKINEVVSFGLKDNRRLEKSNNLFKVSSVVSSTEHKSYVYQPKGEAILDKNSEDINSNIKNVIDNWYLENIYSKFDSLFQTTRYCSDSTRSVEEPHNPTMYYSFFYRINGYGKPSYICPTTSRLYGGEYN